MEKIIKEEDLSKYYMGVDLAFRLKWWQKFLVWLGFRNRWQDYSHSVVFKRLIRVFLKAKSSATSTKTQN